MPRSAKEANNPILLKVQSLQLSFRPAGVSLGGGGGPRPPLAPPPAYAPVVRSSNIDDDFGTHNLVLVGGGAQSFLVYNIWNNISVKSGLSCYGPLISYRK